jgi:hypothetical protein
MADIKPVNATYRISHDNNNNKTHTYEINGYAKTNHLLLFIMQLISIKI